MGEMSSSDNYEVASERLERALARLETGVMRLGERSRSFGASEQERQQLRVDRNRLSGELERAQQKVARLDDGAAQVSRRLVDAMETVKSVLAK